MPLPNPLELHFEADPSPEHTPQMIIVRRVKCGVVVVSAGVAGRNESGILIREVSDIHESFERGGFGLEKLIVYRDIKVERSGSAVEVRRPVRDGGSWAAGLALNPRRIQNTGTDPARREIHVI